MGKINHNLTVVRPGAGPYKRWRGAPEKRDNAEIAGPAWPHIFGRQSLSATAAPR